MARSQHAHNTNRMYFQQVCMTALAFSTARGGTIQTYPMGKHRLDITPPAAKGIWVSDAAQVVIEQDAIDTGAWLVRLERPRPQHSLVGPIYLPAVTTQEGLLRALTRLWTLDRGEHGLMRKCFTRLREPTPDEPTPLGSASVSSDKQDSLSCAPDKFTS